MGPHHISKVNRAIQLNLIAGGLMLASIAVSVPLIASGLLSWGPRAAVWLVFGVVTASLSLWTARSMQQDRDDPAGVERRFETAANALGAAVIILGLASVAGLIAWGLIG
jgi:hypothetical protein